MAAGIGFGRFRRVEADGTVALDALLTNEPGTTVNQVVINSPKGGLLIGSTGLTTANGVRVVTPTQPLVLDFASLPHTALLFLVEGSEPVVFDVFAYYNA